MSWSIDHIGPCYAISEASSVVEVASGEAGTEQRMNTDVKYEPSSAVRRTWRDDLPVAGVAAATAVVIWAVARMSGVDLDVHAGSGTQPVGVFSVAIAPVVATFAAGALLRGWQRRALRARSRWTGLSVAILAFSLLGPVSATTVACGLVLAAMHLTVGAVVIVGLRRRDR
jgi:peptidoglycan/LPS O-acetylase OafA/YrhL